MNDEWIFRGIMRPTEAAATAAVGPSPESRSLGSRKQEGQAQISINVIERLDKDRLNCWWRKFLWRSGLHRDRWIELQPDIQIIFDFARYSDRGWQICELVSGRTQRLDTGNDRMNGTLHEVGDQSFIEELKMVGSNESDDRGLLADRAEATEGGGSKLPAPVLAPEQELPPTLEMLMAEFERHQNHIGDALRSALTHARHAGAILFTIKERVRALGHGWIPWVEEHLRISHRTASMYMRFHLHWPRLEERCRQDRQDIADLTITEANSMLARKQTGGHEQLEQEESTAEDVSRSNYRASIAVWKAAHTTWAPIVALAPSSGPDRESSLATTAPEIPRDASQGMLTPAAPETEPTPNAPDGEQASDKPEGEQDVPEGERAPAAAVPYKVALNAIHRFAVVYHGVRQSFQRRGGWGKLHELVGDIFIHRRDEWERESAGRGVSLEAAATEAIFDLVLDFVAQGGAPSAASVVKPLRGRYRAEILTGLVEEVVTYGPREEQNAAKKKESFDFVAGELIAHRALYLVAAPLALSRKTARWYKAAGSRIVLPACRESGSAE